MVNDLRAGVAAGLLALIAAAPAWAIVIGNADTNKQDYINLAIKPGFAVTNSFGTVSYNRSFSSVGQIYGTSKSGGFAASGVLIDDDWVLTAAHVTSGATSLKFWLDKGGTNFARSGAMKADMIYTYPDWNRTLAPGFDIGLFHLSAPATCVGAGTCKTAAFDNDNLTPSQKPFVIEVGFGKTGTGTGGASSFDGLKRAGTNVLDAYYPNGASNIVLADFDSGSGRDNYTGSTARTVMEAIIAPGDSGGALFDLEGELLGITSFIWGLDGNPNSDFGDAAGWSFVAPYTTWINCVIGGGVACGGSSALFASVGTQLRRSALGVPEPAPALLLGFGLVGLAGVRRRRPA